MRNSRLLLLVLIALPLRAQGADRAFLELDVADRPYYVQERISVTLRFGFEQQFLQRNLIQMLTRRLDVPAQLDAPWIEALPGTTTLPTLLTPSARGTGKRLRFVLNENITNAVRIANREIDGKTFVVLEVQRIYFALHPGKLLIPGSMLRFSYAASFAEDFLGGMVPVDRQMARLPTEPVTRQIVPLPAAGQPLDFGDAVGSFTVTASASPRKLNVGATLKLSLRIAGTGNLHRLELPDLAELDSLHLLGKSETGEMLPGERTVSYDLVPITASVQAIPSIPFTFFDPTPPGQYRTVWTQPIKLLVRALPNAAGTPTVTAVTTPGVDDIFGLKPALSAHGDAETGTSRASRFTLLLMPWLLVLAIWTFRKQLASHRSPAAVRTRGAVNTFNKTLETGDPCAALIGYIAARMHCAPAAVITPDLAARLEACGLERSLAQRTAETLELLVAADYGGLSTTVDTTALSSLVEALETGFRDRQNR